MILWLQISAGRGPAECSRVVQRVAETLLAQAEQRRISARRIDAVPDGKWGLKSCLVSLEGSKQLLTDFCKEWCGSVLWKAPSPFRPRHKRKNWFVGISALVPPDAGQHSLFDPKEVRVETKRASGPGGQHVNKTESAVRILHLPTGLTASAQEERSQQRNRQLALSRLSRKLSDRNRENQKACQQNRWQAHNTLERGNPVRVCTGSLNG